MSYIFPGPFETDPPRWPGETDEQYYRRTGKASYLKPLLVQRDPYNFTAMKETADRARKKWNTLPLVSAAEIKQLQDEEAVEDPVNPSHYGGTEALEAMLDAFGVEKVRDWCTMTAYKYLLRMGKKAGNSVETEAGKSCWYIKTAERLTQQLNDNSGNSGPTPGAPGISEEASTRPLR